MTALAAEIGSMPRAARRRCAMDLSRDRVADSTDRAESLMRGSASSCERMARRGDLAWREPLHRGKAGSVVLAVCHIFTEPQPRSTDITLTHGSW